MNGDKPKQSYSDVGYTETWQIATTIIGGMKNDSKN